MHGLFSLWRKHPIHIVALKKFAFNDVSELVQLVKSGILHALIPDAQCYTKGFSHTFDYRIELFRDRTTQVEISINIRATRLSE